MQLDYGEQAIGKEGGLVDLTDHTIESRAAKENIPFGRAVVYGGDPDTVRLPMLNSVTLTASAAIVASNSTVGAVTVTTINADGTRTTASPANLTATVFDTDTATTMAAIAAKIAAVDGVASATVDGSDSKIVHVLADPDTAIALSGFVTTAGASQATWAAVGTCTEVFAGIAIEKPTTEQWNGVAQYTPGRAVNVLTKGRVYVVPDQNVTVGQSAYMRVVAGTGNSLPGRFRKDADSGKAIALTRVRFLNAITAGEVGALEVALP